MVFSEIRAIRVRGFHISLGHGEQLFTPLLEPK